MNKKLLLPFIVALITISCGQSVKGKNGVTYKSAVQYNDFIVNRQAILVKNDFDFSKIAESNIDSAQNKLRDYITEADLLINEIKGMPPYKGDSALRDAAASSFAFYRKVFEQDYREILAVKKKGEAITEEDVATVNSIVDRIGKEEEGYDKRFHEAQQRYADKNNMKLTDNKMQKELDKVNNGN